MRLRWRWMLLAMAVCSSSLPALAADLTGKWKAEFDTQIGRQKYVFELKADGETVTGKAHFERMGQEGEVALGEGRLSGDQLSFVEPLQMEGMPLVRIEYTGKLTGDEIAFTRKVGDFATETFTATRVKTESPAP